jgi:hypothetical protein
MLYLVVEEKLEGGGKMGSIAILYSKISTEKHSIPYLE